MAVVSWCSDFLVSSVCARDLSLLNSVKYDSIWISVPLGRSTVFYYLRIIFSMQLRFSFFLIMQLQFRFFRIIYLCSYIFLPELVLPKYSVELYLEED